MKSQKQSRQMALKIITAKLADNQRAVEQQGRASVRRSQVGSGMRGDKIRTYRAKDNLVVDNRTGQTWKLRKWIRGEWDKMIK
jgi:peptide chain release factor 1